MRKAFLVLALAVSALASPAFAQWERVDQSVAIATGTNDVVLTFRCDDRSDGSYGIIDVAIPISNVNSGVYGVIYNIDGGIPEYLRKTRYYADGPSGVVLRDTSYVGDDGDYSLNDLAEAVRKGSTLRVEIPRLNIVSDFSLAGSSRALSEIFMECGMRPTGTGVVD